MLNRREFAMAGLGAAIGGVCGLAARGEEAKGAFRRRGLVIMPEDTSLPNWPTRARRAGLTTLALHEFTLMGILSFTTSDAGRAFLDQCRAAKLEIEYELHLMSDLLQRSLFVQHPEWFRMDERGQRKADANGKFHKSPASPCGSMRAMPSSTVSQPLSKTTAICCWSIEQREEANMSGSNRPKPNHDNSTWMKKTRMSYCLKLLTSIICVTAWFGSHVLYGVEPFCTLAKGGQTKFVIVTVAAPTTEEATAALWLSETLEQVTGAKFPIKADGASDLPTTSIRVAADPKLKPEEWRIQTIGKSLLLTGGRPRGTIYAVCEFLETQVGVKRLDPFTEFVPKQPTLTIPALDRRGQPAFPFRFIFTGWPYQNSAPQGVNGVNGSRWRIWNKEHIQAGPINGDYPRTVPDGVHTFGHFISAKEFAAEHPEYFSMDANGKRMTNDMGNKQLWIQVCVTNPDVRRLTLERAKQMLRDDEIEAKKTGRAPARMVVLSQNDNTSNLCLCPNCKAISDREGSESGALLDYVNHVARGLKAEFPDVIVQTEAYNFTLAPPKTIRPEPNVMIRYCDNYGLSDMTRPLTDPRNAERLALLDVWAKSAQQLGIWDYWRSFDPHPPGMFAPSSNVRAIVRDVRLFRERNVKYISLECEDFMGAGLNNDPASYDLQSFMPLRCWLGMKLLDDPDRDVNTLLTTFCKGYYGAAARPMRELLELIEERQSKSETNNSNMRRHVWLESLCDATFFANAYRCLDAATLAAKDDAASLVHVRRERIVIDSAFLWIEASVRRQDPVATAKLPQRKNLLQRHRADWSAYVSSVFDKTGQETLAPLIETGIQLVEKLRTEDTDSSRTAVAITEAEITHDGKLSEPFWQQARSLRLLPRDPKAAHEDRSKFRFAWTAEALYVGIEQSLDQAAAIYEVSLMTPDRKGVQVALHAQPSGVVSAYFYAYPATGMTAVPGRKSLSKFVATKTDQQVTAEFRIPWTDLSTTAKSGDQLLLNIATFPKPDSNVPSHVSSPWLIGASPTYNPAYYATVRLK